MKALIAFAKLLVLIDVFPQLELQGDLVSQRLLHITTNSIAGIVPDYLSTYPHLSTSLVPEIGNEK